MEPNPDTAEVTDESTEEVLQTIEYYDALASTTNEVAKLLSATKLTADSLEIDQTPVDENVPISDPDIARADLSAYAMLDELEQETFPVVLPASNTEGKALHLVAHPINYAFTGAEPNVAINSDAHIIRVREGEKDVYYIMAPHIVNNGSVTDRFIPVAVIGNQDFTSEQGAAFEQFITRNPQVYLDSTKVQKTRDGIVLGSSINNLTLGTVRIKDYKALKAKYDMTNFVESETLLDDLIIQFYNTFFGLDAAGRMLFTKEYELNPDND